MAGSIYLGYKLTTDDTISVTDKSFYQFYESYKVEFREYADEKGDNFSVSLLNDWATVISVKSFYVFSIRVRQFLCIVLL